MLCNWTLNDLVKSPGFANLFVEFDLNGIWHTTEGCDVPVVGEWITHVGGQDSLFD